MTNWKTTLALAVVMGAGWIGAAQADNPLKPAYDVLSNKGEGYDLSDSILGPDSAYDFGGWIAAGYTSNNTGLFNSHQGLDLTQAWLYLEKGLDTTNGFDWGFRFDAVYGIDGPDTQAFGNTPGKWDFDDDFTSGQYGLALPQLYVEVGYKDFSVKAGHFYTLLGYEVVPAPGNFFHSHTFTMYLSEAFTHTGVLGTYTGIKGVELYGGWTAGWDSGFDQYNDGSNFLGGAKISPLDWASITYITTAGDLGWIGKGYTHSIVIDIAATDKLNYMIQSDYVDVEEQGVDYETIGINQLLTYALTDRIGVGARGEWWRANSTDYYGVTAGLNFRLLPNLMLRPEVRYQGSPDAEDNPGRNIAGVPLDQGHFAFDAIFTF